MNPQELRSQLEQVCRRLRVLSVLYGTFRVIAVSALILVGLFLLDRTLTLPPGIRVLFLIAALLVVFWLLLRGVIIPYRMRIRAEDAACAVEKHFPQFDGRLLSTLELEGEVLKPEHNVSQDLVDILRRETGALTAQTRLNDIFNYRYLRRIGVLAVILLGIDIGYSMLEPQLSRIFLERMVGRDVRWPQDTFLIVQFPEHPENYEVTYQGDRPLAVRIARGASLPVTVFAKGEPPVFVELKTSGDQRRASVLGLSPTAGNEWVGRFRAVREPFVFWPHDGNTNDDGHAVSVEVFTPPGVGNVATRLTFPRYTGLLERYEERGDVEAPVGTSVEVEVRVNGDLNRGRLVFDTGTMIDMTPSDVNEQVWVARFDVLESSTYSIDLEGNNGFSNLDSAAYSVISVKDRAPTVRLLEPSRGHSEVTPNSLVPFRVASDDDFGVHSLTLTLWPFGGDVNTEYDLLEGEAPGANSRRRLIYSLLDLSGIAFTHADGQRKSQVGDSYVYSIAAVDGRMTGEVSDPNRTEVADRRIDVVSINEKMRLLTEKQVRLKDDVKSLRVMQEERLASLRDVLSDYEASEGDEIPTVNELAVIEIGQGQITSRSTKLSREFATIFEEYLFNRLDRSAAAERIIPLVVERRRSSTQVDGFDFNVYIPVIDAYQSGEFGTLDVLGRVLGMLRCIIDVAHTLSPAASAGLGEARLTLDRGTRPDGIRRAIQEQEAVLARLDLLLEKMDEWEDFQEILTLFRDLVEDQRDLNARTREALRAGGG